jgi:hypothetical protein
MSMISAVGSGMRRPPAPRERAGARRNAGLLAASRRIGLSPPPRGIRVGTGSLAQQQTKIPSIADGGTMIHQGVMLPAVSARPRQ